MAAYTGGLPLVKKTGRKGNGSIKTTKRGGAPSGAPSAGRAKKVGEIRTAVDAGKYLVEGKKVADKIVDDTVREIRSRLR